MANKVSFTDPQIRTHWFPAEHLTVLFRLWGMFTPEKLATVLEATPEQIRVDMERLGLDPDKKVDPEWRRRGYITIIRDVWHFLSFEQVCTLLDMSEAELQTTLREDDFLDHKTGKKIEGTQCYWRPLTDEEIKRCETIRTFLLEAEKKIGAFPDHNFDFIRNYYEKAEDTGVVFPDFTKADMRFIYSYFALYGDALLDETLDPFPDKLLAEYAKYGVNGVWMQGVLYQLVPYPFAPEMSKGWEKRQKNLQKLVDRAKKYGIGIYLYFNEPRSMTKAFFEKNPDIKGREFGDMACLCTSTPEVKEYLENAAYNLFSNVKGLAGFFTITRSENPTNCYSHTTEANCTCPRCKERTLPEVITEVTNLLYRGAKRANPDARAIAWAWSWPDDRVEECVALLDEGIVFQSTSETNLPTCKGGIKWHVTDYSISNPGPSEWAKNNWKIAKKYNHECSAKLQVCNSWEQSALPYIPTFDLVAEHMRNLKAEGVRHTMLSWTLGGAPTPNLTLACGILDGKYTGEQTRQMIDEIFPEKCRDTVYNSQKIMSDAFREFPFSGAVLYNSPSSAFGPRAMFYAEPTGRHSSMVGVVWDNLDGWRGVYPPKKIEGYPEKVFEGQYAKMVSGFEKALEIIKACDDTSPEFVEFRTCAECMLEHFETTLNLTRFVRARNALLNGETTVEGRDAKDMMFKALEREEINTINAIRTQSENSKIGYEASNHYNYSRQNLLEKLLNVDYTRRYITKKYN